MSLKKRFGNTKKIDYVCSVIKTNVVYGCGCGGGVVSKPSKPKPVSKPKRTMNSNVHTWFTCPQCPIGEGICVCLKD